MVRDFVRAAVVGLPVALWGCAGFPGSAPPSDAVETMAIGSRAIEFSARAAVNGAVTITEFTKGLPKAYSLGDITLGPDGSTMWFADDIDPDFGEDFVGRITPAGAVKRYFLNASFPSLYGITTGPDGALWLTDYGDSAIVRLSTSGKFTQYSLGGNQSPAGITVGPDDALWFTENNPDIEPGYGIGRITTAGAVTTFSQGIPASSRPTGIVAGPDSALWFTETSANAIARITTTGSVTTFKMGISPEAQLGSITSGPDGALWFTEKNAIGRITTAGAVTEYRAGLATGAIPGGIVASGGALWFTERGKVSEIGRITTTGSVTQYAQGITPQSAPLGIAAGAGKTIWFTEGRNNAIGRLTF